MSQHDMVIDNAAGAAFRADINNAFLAIVSDHSGTTEPATMYAYQWWADTTTGLLKQRNAANSAWIVKSKLASDMISALQKQEFTAFTTAGTSTAYTLTTSPALAALTNNECFKINFHTTSGSAPTLARDGLTPKLIKQYDSTGSKVTASVTAGQLCYVEYDGTDYVVLNPLPSVYPSSEKIPTTGCAQAAGALTFTMGACVYDFGDATLTSGTVTQVTGTPADLVLPSGGTLGTITTVEANIYRAVINNGGTMEQAIIQPIGTTDLSEEGVISTTAIGTGSDSLGVWYSTTARTNVAYRIVGLVKSVNTAGAWGDPTLIRGSSGRMLLETRGGSYATALTSGSSLQINGIPSYAKKVNVIGRAISTDGTADIRVQGGAGVTAENSTYNGSTSHSTTTTAWVTGVIAISNTVAADAHEFKVVLELVDATNKRYSAVSQGSHRTTTAGCNGSGSANFTDIIGCIRVITTDAFDGANGQITVTWE